jgi:hypothetical protein
MELELKRLYGLHVYNCTHKAEAPPQLLPSPRIWAQIQGRYWSAKIDDISW